MAAKVGDVVFKAGEAINMEEFWDDSALIKAYEKAVNSFKFGTGDEPANISQSKPNHNTKKKKRRKNRQNKRDTKSSCDEVDIETLNWSVGDKCSAVYSEDGLIYDAEIIEICSEVDMCVVRYLEYGNEEQQSLADLMSASWEDKNGSYLHQNGEHSDTASSKTGDRSKLNWRVSDLCVAPEPPYQHYHEAVINSFSSSLTCTVTFIRSRKSHNVKVQDLQRSNDFSQNNTSHHPYPNTNMMPPMPQFPSHGAFMGIPRPPVPPPPPPVSLDDLQGDDESLASMLMSWYLSGYHTGYFKAVQQFKRNHPTCKSSELPGQPTCQSNANPQSPGTNMDTKE